MSRPGRSGGWALITARRIGAAIGVAVIGNVLFGSGSAGNGSRGGSASGSGPARVMPSLVHTAQWAAGASLVFVPAALACALELPRTLGAGRAAGKA